MKIKIKLHKNNKDQNWNKNIQNYNKVRMT